VGDLRDLSAVGRWVRELGGAAVSTLPLLASFLDEPLDPSPYAPVSRRFWNELYLDLSAVPELRSSSRARRVVESAGFKAETRRLRAMPRVDHRAAMAVKRRVLEVLCAELHRVDSQRRGAFERFVAQRQGLEDYARFRATVEKRGAPWGAWPARLRDGKLRPGDGDQRVERYHRYVQWLMSEQLGKLARTARSGGADLALDLPVGVHPDGFDSWRERAAFVDGVSAGAPPDDFFPWGQNWGFRPLHPQRSREQGHRYFIESLRNHLQFAGVLRIDHIMGLHRLYWVPEGFAADEGTYVRYPAEELYAVICIESHRHGSRIVGEDLGTVPAYVRSSMKRHGVERLYALQAALPTRARRRVPAVPASAVASLNTHDMPTFAGFWGALDIDERVELGLLEPEQAGAEHTRRGHQREACIRELRRRGHVTGNPPSARTAVRGSLVALASSSAATVLVSLEDLWLETRPQNVPGTTTERPNWRRKASLSLEAIRRDKRIRSTLRAVDRRRRRPK
jgi:4-alpha-glucanotransferase